MSRESETSGPITSAMSEGGPWGGKDEDTTSRGGSDGPRNPWTPSQGDQGRASDRGPSAFDELMRRARDSFGGGGEDGPNYRRVWALVLGAVLVLWVGTTSPHSIGEKQRGVVSFLGSYSRTLGPGFNMTLPAPFETVEVVEFGEIRSTDMGSAGGDGQKLVLTGDQNLLNLSYSVRWNVSNARQFAFQLAEPEDAIKQVADSAMRGVIANVVLTDAMGSGRRTIEQQVQQRMQEILDGYGSGVSIQGVAINKADPPNEVITAFKEVTAAQQDADGYINNANGYAQQIAAKAQGDAVAFDKVYEQYKLAPDVTRRRIYYETMESVLKDVNKTVIEANGVTPYLPLPPAAQRPNAEGNVLTVTGGGR
ncbi:MAG: protease modulator HflK [Sphingobium sp.]|nr:protease modulator HflK [Sphingobium sp.]